MFVCVTFPVAVIASTLKSAELLISLPVMVPSDILALVIALSAKSVEPIVPAAILAPVTALSARSVELIVPAAIFAPVTELSAKSAVAIVPAAILAPVTALSAKSAVATAPSVILVELTTPVPPRLPIAKIPATSTLSLIMKGRLSSASGPAVAPLYTRPSIRILSPKVTGLSSPSLVVLFTIVPLKKVTPPSSWA